MNPVLIVAGHGRCGSSLTMQMLAAGGVPAVGEYPAFEPSESSALDMDPIWLATQAGRAVKILDPHLTSYRFIPQIPRLVIWLDRDTKQQAKSIIKFGRAVQGLPFNNSDWKALAAGLKRDRTHAHEALGMGQCSSLILTFENMIGWPMESAARMASFLAPHLKLDVQRAASAVISRQPECLPYLLETQLLEAM